MLASEQLTLRAILTGPKDEPPPERTLGNAALAWAETNLLQPDGPRAGKPWRFTDEQIHFVLNWYAIDDNGRFVYRNGVYRRMKGAGKNPFAAVLAAIEFVGPCRFAEWDEDGTPISVPVHSAWVQCAGVTKDSTRNTMPLFPALFSRQVQSEMGIELGKELIYAHNGRCRIEAVTSSPLALEGARATFIVRDETHHWLSNNEGHAMAAVIERNAAKSRDGAARVLSITNAHNPGEDSVGQRDYEAYQQIVTGRSKASGVIYDCREAPPEVDLRDVQQLRAGLEAARGDAEWLDIPRLIEEILDPRTDPSVARRYYLNQIVAAEDAWITPQQWDVLRQPELLLLPEEEVCLGLDGSKTDDHTALMACRVSDGALFALGLWDPADTAGEIDTADVDLAVRRAMDTYLVNGFFADVAEWESYIDKWESDWGEKFYVHSTARHSIGWDMRGRQRESTQAAEALHSAIVDKAVHHNGDRRLAQYFYNARRRPNAYGVTFGKEHRESPRKVDAVAASMLARMARQQYVVLPENKKRRKRSNRVMYA